jgi:MFS family permease
MPPEAQPIARANVPNAAHAAPQQNPIAPGAGDAQHANDASGAECHPSKRSIHALEGLNFFLADVQTGLGPFLAAYLAAGGWAPDRVGYALTFGGLVTVALQTPAGAAIDAIRRKRLLLAAALVVLVAGAILLMGGTGAIRIYAAQFLIGGAGPLLAPTVAAITLGLVGARAFDRQFGRNQSFNAAGNVAAALLVAWVAYRFGYRAIFIVAAALAIPTALCLFSIDKNEIDYARARGAAAKDDANPAAARRDAEGIAALAKDRVLLAFLAAAFLFHLANAAMLPELGEMLAKGKPREAAPFMSACIIVTQLVIAVTAVWIAKRAAVKGRKPLLLVGFGVLPLRGVLYTLTHAVAALVAIQVLDGIANAIFGIVSILVIKDRTDGTGRFNVAAGALATMVGIGAASSNAVGGWLVGRFNFSASFLGLAAIAAAAVGLLYVTVPETLNARKA